MKSFYDYIRTEGGMKMKIYRVKYGWSFFHIRNPFTMWRFLHNADACDWCDRLYNLIKSSPLV